MESSRKFPCVTIEYCTQCKWLLRAAYFAQELLSTFSTTLGEVALRPSTGGRFVIEVWYSAAGTGDHGSIQNHIIWDRKTDGGFPETKELKRRVRDIIDPARNLGHVDGHSKAAAIPAVDTRQPSSSTPQLETETSSTGMAAEAPIPKAIGRLQEGRAPGPEERKFTPMDVDVESRPDSRNENGEAVNERGKIIMGGEEGAGSCRPGDEDCGW